MSVAGHQLCSSLMCNVMSSYRVCPTCEKPAALTLGMGIAGLLATDTAGKASVDDTAGGLGVRTGGAGGRFATAAAALEPPHTLCTGGGCATAKFFSMSAQRVLPCADHSLL